MSATAAPAVTAGLRPELFAAWGGRGRARRWLVCALAVLACAGFALRAAGLSAEGLSEDEYNKLEAVADYRAHGLTPANGEHPFLMKALQTASVVCAERWNALAFVAARPALQVRVETALRLPGALAGALTVLALYFVTAELFGGQVALVAAALWAFDPAAIAFNRVAKEDTFLTFFFLLANVFWLRSQRLAESGAGDPRPYYWATAVSFGAMMASKYTPGYFAASICYYHIFQAIPATRWRLGKPRFLLFFCIIGVTFVLLNLPILLPDTWRMALSFASYKRLGHDSYEFMGRLYSHKLMDWFKGVPWYYYLVFLCVKTPPLTLAAFLVGLPQLFRRRLGDGRYFLLFWVAVGLMPFVFVGGKFTRYFAPVLPVVHITAAIGIQLAGRTLARLFKDDAWQRVAPAALGLVVVLAAAWASLTVAPHYRLYTNALGGGESRAGFYFPQDEFYDAGLREALASLARSAPAGARVGNETPALAAFYLRQAGRADLASVPLSEPDARTHLRPGDYVVAARGRRYHSNEALLDTLRQTTPPAVRVALGTAPAVEVYQLNEQTAALAARP
ncbi:MAG TPA: glycosyltransferase family 39 protein [Pyrinomonadaceae bacterium]